MPEIPLPPVGAVSNRAYGTRCVIPINSIAVSNRAYETRCVIPINSIYDSIFCGKCQVAETFRSRF